MQGQAATRIQAYARGKAARRRVGRYRIASRTAVRLPQAAARARQQRRLAQGTEAGAKAGAKVSAKGGAEEGRRAARERAREEQMVNDMLLKEARSAARERAREEQAVDDVLSGIFAPKLWRQPEEQMVAPSSLAQGWRGAANGQRPAAAVPIAWEALRAQSSSEEGSAIAHKIPMQGHRNSTPAPPRLTGEAGALKSLTGEGGVLGSHVPESPRSMAPVPAAHSPRRELEERVRQLEAELVKAQQKLRSPHHHRSTSTTTGRKPPPDQEKRRRPSPKKMVDVRTTNTGRPWDSKHGLGRGGPTEGTLLPPLSPSKGCSAINSMTPGQQRPDLETPVRHVHEEYVHEELSWERYRS